MDLINRYVAAVRRHLPRPQPQDIVEELADNLRSEAEAAEQRLGRPLTLDDQAALLQTHGHPWLMASRYLPQRYLIGPALYPYYRQATTLVVFWLVLPITLVGGAIAAMYAPNAWQTWARALGAAWSGAIYAVGIITLVFAVFESQQVRITGLDNWKASTLPEPQGGRSVSRGESLFSLVVGLSFLVLWMDIVAFPEFVDAGGEGMRLVPDAIWTTVYVPILLNLLVSLAGSLVDMVRPLRTTFFAAVRVANALALTAITVVALQAGHWVTVTADPAWADKATRVDGWLNGSLWWTFVVVAAVTAFNALSETWQLVQARREVRA